jgi:hypothetical protein
MADMESLSPLESCGLAWVDRFRQTVRRLRLEYAEPANVVALADRRPESESESELERAA